MPERKSAVMHSIGTAISYKQLYVQDIKFNVKFTETSFCVFIFNCCQKLSVK